MPKTIQLTAFRGYQASAVMLHLARGQLNRAYRFHGLRSPDCLEDDGRFASDPADLDDPLAHGVDQARTKFGDAFSMWESRMPADLVGPVLDILGRTYIALSLQAGPPEAQAAALDAAEILKRAAVTGDDQRLRTMPHEYGAGYHSACGGPPPNWSVELVATV